MTEPEQSRRAWLRAEQEAVVRVVAAVIIAGSLLWASLATFNRAGDTNDTVGRLNDLATFQQANLDRTLCVSEITSQREIGKAESASADNALDLYVLDVLRVPGARDDTARADRIAGRIRSADAKLAVALALTDMQPWLCPAPELPVGLGREPERD